MKIAAQRGEEVRQRRRSRLKDELQKGKESVRREKKRDSKQEETEKRNFHFQIFVLIIKLWMANFNFEFDMVQMME